MLLTGAVRSLFLGSLFVPTFSSAQKDGGKHGMLRRVLYDVPLKEVGNNGDPMSVFPFGKCEGDCDTDHDCSGSLKCYNLDGLGLGKDMVPGCSGYRRTTPAGATVDYCYEPEVDGTLKLNEVGNNGVPMAVFPFGKCEGDCDTDHDCSGSLKCYNLDGLGLGKDTVPGCSGYRRTTPAGATVDYCYEPEVDGTLKLNEVGNNGSPESAFPLGLCEGDCDSDDECADGYKCFDSNHGNTVPGCSGTRRKNKAGNYVDFCYAA